MRPKIFIILWTAVNVTCLGFFLTALSAYPVVKLLIVCSNWWENVYVHHLESKLAISAKSFYIWYKVMNLTGKPQLNWTHRIAFFLWPAHRPLPHQLSTPVCKQTFEPPASCRCPYSLCTALSRVKRLLHEWRWALPLSVFCSPLDRQPNESAFLWRRPAWKCDQNERETLICRIIKELHRTLEGNILLLCRSSLKHTCRHSTAISAALMAMRWKKKKKPDWWHFGKTPRRRRPTCGSPRGWLAAVPIAGLRLQALEWVSQEECSISPTKTMQWHRGQIVSSNLPTKITAGRKSRSGSNGCFFFIWVNNKAHWPSPRQQDVKCLREFAGGDIWMWSGRAVYAGLDKAFLLLSALMRVFFFSICDQECKKED